MREIKFRQENNGQKPKCWHYWGFIDGIFCSPFQSIAGGKSYQYTGLKDKNGIEIYEGDIVKEDEFIYKGGESVLEIVKWDNGWVKMGMSSAKFAYNSDKKFEIIGNTYENPELLIPKE